MLFPIFISLLIKAIKAQAKQMFLTVQKPGVFVTVTISQTGREDFTAQYLENAEVPLLNLGFYESTIPVTLKLKTIVCEETKEIDISGSSSQIYIRSSDIPDNCFPRSVTVNIDTSIPSLYKFGYKINSGQIVAAESTTIQASNLKSTDTLSLYLIESGYSGNYLLQTYQAQSSSFNTFRFNDIPEVCYLYEIQVSFVSIPNYYNFFYKIGNDEEQAITEDLLHLSPIAKGTQVQIFVQSSTCPNFMNVGTFTTKVVSPNTASDEITENDIPSECASKFYLSFDFSELDIGNDVKFSYYEDGKPITVTKFPISKQAQFSITIKVTSERSGCSEYKLGIFYGEKDNPQNIITITKEMLFKSQVPDSCIYPKRYIRISENFQDPYISICYRKDFTSYRYTCSEEGNENIEDEYYGPSKTYEISYISRYCCEYNKEYKVLKNVVSNTDINEATFEFSQDDLLSECRTRHELLVAKVYDWQVDYTLPDGVTEAEKTLDSILFTGRADFSIKFQIKIHGCDHVYEGTFHTLPPEQDSCHYPKRQDLYDFIDMSYCDDNSSFGPIEIGIIIGCLAVVAIIVIIIVVVIRCVRKRRQKARNQESTTLESNLLNVNE